MCYVPLDFKVWLFLHELTKTFFVITNYNILHFNNAFSLIKMLVHNITLEQAAVLWGGMSFDKDQP